MLIGMSYTITIFDSSGKVLKQMKDQGNTGYNEIQFDRRDIQNTGNLYYRIDTELGQSDTKIITTNQVINLI